MRNAFAPIVRARPCPIFGRPVRLRGRPHRLQPDTSPHALRIPDRSGHPALRDIPSSWLKVCLGCVRLSPSCPFRLLHTRLLSRPARRYPRFRIRPSSSERRGDFNPHDSRAAQRTLQASPPPHSAQPLPHGRLVGHPRPRSGASRVARAFLVCVPPPLPRCSGWASSSLISPSRNSLPRKRCRVGLHIV